MIQRLFAIAVLLVSVTTAQAEDADSKRRDEAEAKRLFDVGAKAFTLGEYDKAVTAHKRAYELSGHPVLLFNIAQAYRKLGDNDHALHFYRQFLSSDPSGKMRDDAEAHVKRLEALAATTSSTKVAPPNGLGDVAETPTVTTVPPPQTTTAAVLTSPPAEKPKRKTGLIVGVAIGAVVVVGLAVGLGVGLGTRDRYFQPSFGQIAGN